MRSRNYLLLAALCALGVFFSACGGQAEKTSSNRHIVVPSKADNYYSDRAAEFELTGKLPVNMTSDEYESEAKRNEIISKRLTAVGLYLTAYMTKKLDDHFENTDYGGFQAMVRNYSAEQEDLVGQPGQNLQVEFTIDVAGPPNLPKQLLDVGGQRTASGVQFSLQMPKGATSDPSSVNRGEFRDFDPSSHSGELETITLTTKKLPSISDAYPHYRDFLSDGVYSITLFYGHDYNESRTDIKGAKDAFTYLATNGFNSPVTKFQDLNGQSGPFTKTIKLPTPNRTGYKEVTLEVRMFHSNMFKNKRKQQKEIAKRELTKRDVFFYNGHAGPYYGFYLDPNDKAEIDYRQFANLDFQDKQQLFVAQGCQTYSQYADALYANPAKSESNLDVITTVNYSYGKGTLQLLKNLVKVKQGKHQPVSMQTMVQQLNDQWVNDTKNVFYGVMGMDGNSHLHPYANPDSVGQPCSNASECGSERGNACVKGQTGQKTCVAKALAEGSCPSGTTFGYLGEDNELKEGVCFAQTSP